MVTRVLFSAAAAAVGAVVLGYHLHLPSVVVPPHVPADSPTHLLPPWAIFRSSLNVIDWIVRISMAIVPPEIQIQALSAAYANSAVLYALTKHNIIDSIGRGPKNCSEVAQELELMEHAVCQFTNAGSYMGILKRSTDGTLSLTHSGAIVQTNAPNSLRDYVLATNEGIFDGWRGATTKSIKTGESGIKESSGHELWEYYSKFPEEGEQFDRFMRAASFPQLGAILSSWRPPSDSATFCDIGGGLGSATVQFLDHYPNASAIVFDRTEIMDQRKTFLTERGLSGRANGLGGDIFQPFPKDLASCDVFFLKFIMHDWPDNQAAAILKNVKDVAKKGAKVVVADVVLESGQGLALDLVGSMCSLNMLAASPFGARERTLKEFSDLFATAGFENEVELIPIRDVLSVIEVDC